MDTRNNYVRIMCEIGIFAAIGFVLDELQGIISKGLFINGGSIGFAMLAVIVIGYRRGWLPALLTGLIMGALDISTSAYIIHPAQLFLDYLLPYGLVANKVDKIYSLYSLIPFNHFLLSGSFGSVL